ncbi:MAG: PD-(D/E)XK nuclease family transposase [Muribaculaceae bacterium]|nr:PD-(D/E)XK nuclease family transposase [Muribaculaceae bacterium]
MSRGVAIRASASSRETPSPVAITLSASLSISSFSIISSIKSSEYNIACKDTKKSPISQTPPQFPPADCDGACTLDEETFKPIGAKTRYIYVQLESFDKKESECENLNDKWIYNIKSMGIRQEVAFKQNSEIFRRLSEVANVATLTPQQRYEYEADVKMVRDTINQIRGAFQDGENKGHAEGHAEGRAEGRAEGEGNAKKEIARKMLKEGLDISMIASFTGLSISEIESL